MQVSPDARSDAVSHPSRHQALRMEELVAWKHNLFVLANVTADSDELLSALERRAMQRPASFMLVLPPSRGGSAARAVAERRLRHALLRAAARGLEIDGVVGDPDPILAVVDAFDPRRYDEIIVS